MKQQEILARLRDIIIPYLDNPCEIEMETDLIKDLAINSVDFINIVMEAEDTFQCSMEYEQILQIHLMKDLVQYIINFCYG